MASARDTVRTELWPLPVAGIVLAALVALTLPRLDARLNGALPSWLTGMLFNGDAGAARTLLDSISSSLMTVTSLTFSLTVVTLQLASSQFSPRLLRTFTSDVFVQATLAMFLSTFTYSLTLLRAIRSSDTGAAFVPRVSITLAFLLALGSVVCLVFFLAHLAKNIRVETMLRYVHDDANATVDGATEPLGDAAPPPELPSVPTHARRLLAPSSGFLTSIDEDELRDAAIEFDAVVVVHCHPGMNIVEGVPIGEAWAVSGEFVGDAFEELTRAVGKTIRIGYERTAAQDVGFGLRQLTDVANKALSPGINDPTTAIHALGHISAILCRLARRDLNATVLCDDERVRAVLHRPSFADLVDAALTQPRRYGASDPQVMARLFGVLEEVAWHETEGSVVRDQLARLHATVDQSDFDEAERGRLRRAAERVDGALAAMESDESARRQPKGAVSSMFMSSGS